MQIDKKTNKLKSCECGYIPDEYSIGYGTHPYYISCLGCGKSIHGGSGIIGEFIKLWNRHYRFIHAPNKLITHKYTREAQWQKEI